MYRWLSILIGGLIVSTGSLANAQGTSSDVGYLFNSPLLEEEPVRMSLIYENETIQPGHSFWVALHLNIENHWHTYWKNPGDAGMATSIHWQLPEGFTASSIYWPYPKRINAESGVGFGYEGEVTLLVEMTPPATLPLKSVPLAAEVHWLVCSDTTCLPGQTSVSATLPVSSDKPKPKGEWIQEFSRARGMLPKKVEGKVRAKRKNTLVELNIAPSVGNLEVTDAEFFPDIKKRIDHKAEAIISKDEKNPGHYVLVLKEATKSDSLKGVLVLHTNSSVVAALEVDTPIAADPSDTELSMADVNANAPVAVPLSKSMAEKETMSLGLGLIMAFVGGMILNLMPCVLPVISLKIFSFVKMAGQNRTIILKHGAFFAVGILVSFWVLAGVMLALQAYGSSVGWGFQLQEPLFVGVLASLLLVFGLSLFGVFEIGTSVMSAAGSMHSSGETGVWGSFLSGVLATAVATPCTGPFLGSAVGFAVTLPPLLAMLIFTSLGLGMAFPYLILSAFPALLRFIPKPGPWMVTFKEIMGFFMIATVLWLVWVFGAQTSSLGVFLLLIGFFFLSLGCWIYGKWGSPIKNRMTRGVGYVMTVVCLIVATYAILNSTAEWVSASEDTSRTSVSGAAASIYEWEDFSPERVADLQAKGIPVFIDFTARWCLICQANHVVLSVDEVTEKMAQLGVVKMLADWTRNDPVITRELRKLGRNGVPLYVLYGKSTAQEPLILPQVLTPEIVLNSLKEITPKAS